MGISLIAAMGRNFVIGDESGLPWRMPADLKRFRERTWGKALIMGRKTMELIGSPLPGRDSIVLSRDAAYAGHGFHVARDVESALALARELGGARGQGEVMVIGGGEVYRQFLPRAGRVYLTVIDGAFAGTATFPFAELCSLGWSCQEASAHPADAKNAHAHRFAVLDRVEGGPAGFDPRGLVESPVAA